MLMNQGGERVVTAREQLMRAPVCTARRQEGGEDVAPPITGCSPGLQPRERWNGGQGAQIAPGTSTRPAHDVVDAKHDGCVSKVKVVQEMYFIAHVLRSRAERVAVLHINARQYLTYEVAVLCTALK